MPKTKIDQESVIKTAARLANETGIENLSLKSLAVDLHVKSPSLYNHVQGLDDLKQQIMLYGWREMEEQIIQAVIGLSGYDAVRAMCYAFHQYTRENPGIFSAMLWYNKFENEKTQEVTRKMFSLFYQVTQTLHISQDDCTHLVRMFRGFLEGFTLLENHHAFGSEQSVEESFALAVDLMIEGMKKLSGEMEP